MKPSEYAKKYKQIVKDYAEYKPKSPMDDAKNAARCHNRLCSLECDAILLKEEEEYGHWSPPL